MAYRISAHNNAHDNNAPSSETHGARHMGEPAEGRGRNWKSFIEMLDSVELTPEEDAELEQAANDAFSRFTFLLEQTYVKQPELA